MYTMANTVYMMSKAQATEVVVGVNVNIGQSAAKGTKRNWGVALQAGLRHLLGTHD